jgi:hypothetical protein
MTIHRGGDHKLPPGQIGCQYRERLLELRIIAWNAASDSGLSSRPRSTVGIVLDAYRHCRHAEQFIRCLIAFLQLRHVDSAQSFVQLSPLSVRVNCTRENGRRLGRRLESVGPLERLYFGSSACGHACLRHEVLARNDAQKEPRCSGARGRRFDPCRAYRKKAGNITVSGLFHFLRLPDYRIWSRFGHERIENASYDAFAARCSMRSRASIARSCMSGNAAA